jgi:hypothetical protein
MYGIIYLGFVLFFSYQRIALLNFLFLITAQATEKDGALD